MLISCAWLAGITTFSLACVAAAEETDKPVGPPTSAPITTQPAPVTTQPTATLQTAAELWLEGKYAEALEQYDGLAEQPSAAVDAHIGLARCGLMTGDYEGAIAALDRVADDAVESPAWHTARAEILACVGRYEEALGHARRALSIQPRFHQARYTLGRLLEYTGRRDEAIEVYSFFDTLLTRQVPPTARGITAAASGFYRYSVLTRHPNLTSRTKHVLQNLLHVAYKQVDRYWWPAQVAAADLLRAKYNLEEAAEDYQEALEINPHLPPARVGLGRVALEGWRFEEVERQVEAALQINPRCVPALTLRARSKIQERRYDEALEACEHALTVNPRDVEALSLGAAAQRCKYDAEAAQVYVRRVDEINPRSARLYGILGDALSGLRQYADSEAAYLKSIEYEPTDPNPRTELGMMYMQWGHEDKARDALEAAWQLDVFNERTFNTLALLEKLEAFERLETEHFVILYDAQVDGAIAPYLASVAEEIYDDVCADYETDLEQKTIIEVFPTHRDFGVRITGKPWIYTVGACTGWVVALDSPRDHPQTRGTYHYARVLRHEFIHVVTLALTRNRIAHWFTEGLAVHGEDAPRSFEWCRMLAGSIRQQRLFTLESIDWGFVRPKRKNDRQLAYAQSEWMVEYIVHRYGYDSLLRILQAFRAAKPQPQVFREVLGIEPEDFDREFAAWARRDAEPWGLDLSPIESVVELRAAAVLEPGDAAMLGRLARAELDEGNVGQALEASRKALAIDENEVNGLTVFAEVLAIMRREADSQAERDRFDEEALPNLRRLADVDPQGWMAPRLLGDIALRRKAYDEAVRWFKRLKRVCPLHPASYRGLGGIYLERGDPEAALPELLELARMEEHDPGVAAGIGRIFAEQDRLGEARYWYQQALYIDAFDRDTHRKLAEVHMRLGDTQSAVEEYAALCRLEPQEARDYADAAFAYHKLGDTDKARRYAQQALELDPESPARSLVE